MHTFTRAAQNNLEGLSRQTRCSEGQCAAFGEVTAEATDERCEDEIEAFSGLQRRSDSLLILGMQSVLFLSLKERGIGVRKKAGRCESRGAREEVSGGVREARSRNERGKPRHKARHREEGASNVTEWVASGRKAKPWRVSASILLFFYHDSQSSGRSHHCSVLVRAVA